MFSCPLSSKKEEEKCSHLVIWWGEKGRDIVKTWSDQRGRQEKTKNLPRVFSRYKLHNPSSRQSGDDGTVGNWLKTTGQGLCFQGTNEKIRDRIWLVQILTKLEKKLINVVEDLITCQRYWNSENIWTVESTIKVNLVKQQSGSWQKLAAAVQKKIFQHTFQGTNTIMWKMWPSSCPAMGKIYLKCGKANHFARLCKTNNKQVHEVTEGSYKKRIR